MDDFAWTNILPHMQTKYYLIKRIFKLFCLLILLALAILLFFPVLMTVTGAFRENWELKMELGPVFGQAAGAAGDVDAFASWTLLPLAPDLSHLWTLLTQTPVFFVMFWNSVKLTLLILIGQVVTATPAAWALAKGRFPGRKTLSGVYLVLMLMPFQVMMLPSYLVLSRLHLLDTHAGVILPAVFSTFPVFIMIHAFSGIPEALLEAARIDGAGEWTLFCRLGLPLGAPGIAAALLLSFIENWNMIEQPMTFLKDQSLWPLSLFSGDLPLSYAGEGFAAALLMLFPALLAFLFGGDFLEQGITVAVKE